ncbi:DnaT-like ssDNA-binding protein, partial [Sinorhizobium meliloti]
AQERAWPRTGATTYYGEAIPSNDTPAAIVNASYEAAFLELTNPGSLSPVVTGTQTVKREKIGQLEVEYSASSSTDIDDLVALATPVVTTIEGLLWPFLTPVWPGALVV